METMADLYDGDHRLARRAIAWGPPWVRQVAPAVQEAAEHTKLWWAAAAAMAATPAAAMTTVQVLSNSVAKPLYRRRGPPSEWVPQEELDDRPDSSSFPSGHTAAAFGFAGAVAPVWPAAGAACGISAAMVAAERVHSGAHRRGRRSGDRAGRGRPGTGRTPFAAETGLLTGGDAWLPGYSGGRSDGLMKDR
ncbi:phosphatase PAP2 family protein [Streptomyces cupreus]|uniref:phosphatase PAP2 family protein n=1 Tax=Streptomyces cupreus TaxID=2759956 RepID=UPI0021B18DE4|nr:phosphatase PAP2 family protein [Streptomyces cupreus]